MKPATRERSQSYYRDFGARLRTLRQLRGYTEREAAATAGVTLRTWRRREAGSVAIRNDGWLSDFAEKYNVSYTWLICGAGPIGLSEYRAQMAELKGLPPFVAEQMIPGKRPRLRVVK
jgi:transcriptional regulator with XRE-family HTH domain